MKTFVIPYCHFQHFSKPFKFTHLADTGWVDQSAYVLSNKTLNEFFSDECLPQSIVEQFFSDSKIISSLVEEYSSCNTRIVYYQLHSCDFFDLADQLSEYPELSAGVTNMFKHIPKNTPSREKHWPYPSLLNNTDTVGKLYTHDSSIRAAAGILLEAICSKFVDDKYGTPLLIEQALLTDDVETVSLVNRISEQYSIFVLIRDDTETANLIKKFWKMGYRVLGVVAVEQRSSGYSQIYPDLSQELTNFVYVTTCIRDLLEGEDDDESDYEEFDMCITPLRFCVTNDTSVWDSPEFNELADGQDPAFITKNVSEVCEILNFISNNQCNRYNYPDWIKESHQICYRR